MRKIHHHHKISKILQFTHEICCVFHFVCINDFLNGNDKEKNDSIESFSAMILFFGRSFVCLIELIILFINIDSTFTWPVQRLWLKCMNCASEHLAETSVKQVWHNFCCFFYIYFGWAFKNGPNGHSTKTRTVKRFVPCIHVYCVWICFNWICNQIND